jgi:hypothetical protein
LVGFLVFVFVGSFVGEGDWLAGVPPVEIDDDVLVFVAAVDVLVTAAGFVLAGTPVLADVTVGVLLGRGVLVALGSGVALGGGVSVAGVMDGLTVPGAYPR